MIGLMIRAGLLLGFFLSFVSPVRAVELSFTCTGYYQTTTAAYAACIAASPYGACSGFNPVTQGGCPFEPGSGGTNMCFDADPGPEVQDYRCYGATGAGCAAPAVPDENGRCTLPACGTQGTRFDTDYPHACEANPPEQCPFGEIYHPVTGDCFMPPVCEPPEYLSVDQTQCIQPNCGPGKQYNVALKRCVADPPTCGPGQHLVGSSSSSFAPYCEDNPECPPGQDYGTVVFNGESRTGCWGPQDCGDGKVWGAVNGIYGCYGEHVGPKDVKQKNPGDPPQTEPTPPLGGKCTDCGKAEYPPSGDGGGGAGGVGGGVVGGGGGSPTETGQNTAAGTGSSRGGLCNGGKCVCNPNSTYGIAEIPCPESGVCPHDYYSSSSGACTKSPGDCPVGQHFEYENLSCVADSAFKPAKDSNDEIYTGRLDKIIENTGKTADTLKEIKDLIDGLDGEGLQPVEKGSFGSEAQDALDEAKAELENKLQEIKTSMSNMFDLVAGGSGGLPVWHLGNIKGTDVTIDFNKAADAFSIIAAAIMAVAWLDALRIILGGR